MADNGDARDERLAGLLDVEPLDDLTRRRLVSTALRTSAPAARGSGAVRSRRLVAAAAIVGLVCAAGVGYLLARGDGSSTTTTASRDRAAPTSPPTSASRSATGGESLSPSAAAPTAGGAQAAPKTFGVGAGTPRDAGDFGTRDAIVVETERPDGTRSIDAVVAHPCEVRPLD